jgi:hypothetical protein
MQHDGGSVRFQVLTAASMMMEAVRTSETSVDNNFTRQYIPEDNSEHDGGSLSCSQKLTTSPCPEPDESSPHPRSHPIPLI